jgi:hypothetical protein
MIAGGQVLLEKPSMRKAIVLSVVLAAIVAVAIGLEKSPHASREHLPAGLQSVLGKLDDVKIGMSTAEVDAIFSGQTRSESAAPSNLSLPYTLEVTYSNGGIEGDYYATARFDAHGRLVEKRWGQWVK